MTDVCPPDECPITSPLVPVPAFTEGQRERLVRVLKALADATRLEVFQLIAAQPEPICVCDIVAHFDVSQPTISHHLKVLRDAGLVTAKRRGVWAYYAVRHEELALVHDLLGSVQRGSLATVK